MIKITYVILHFNQSRRIVNTLYSIVNSQLDNNQLELIILDDCSNVDEYKNLVKIIKEIRKKNNFDIKLYTEKNNTKNQSYLRNKGIKYATGKYIAFLDGDDYINPFSLKEIYNFLSNNSEYKIMFTTRILGWNINNHRSYNKMIVDPKYVDSYGCGISNYIIDIDFVKRYDIYFDENIYNFYAEDLYFFAQLMDIIKQNNILYHVYNTDWYYCGLKRSTSTFVNDNAIDLKPQYWIGYFKFLSDKIRDNDTLMYCFQTIMKFLRKQPYNKRIAKI